MRRDEVVGLLTLHSVANAPRIKWDEAEHSLHVDGVRFLSVTQVLKDNGLLDFSGADPAALQAAMDLGTEVHKATQLNDENALGMCDESVLPFVASWNTYRRATKTDVLVSEYLVYDPKYRVFGWVDAVAMRNNQLGIPDKKTGSGSVDVVALQTAGYRHCFESMFPTLRIRWTEAVRLTAEGFKVVPFADATAGRDFLTLVNASWTRKKYGKSNIF